MGDDLFGAGPGKFLLGEEPDKFGNHPLASPEPDGTLVGLLKEFDTAKLFFGVDVKKTMDEDVGVNEVPGQNNPLETV